MQMNSVELYSLVVSKWMFMVNVFPVNCYE